MGLKLSSSTAGRNLLQQYLDLRSSDQRATCVTQPGWHGRAFVLPDETIGEQAGERVLLQTFDHRAEGFKVAGSVDDWRDRIGRRCADNSRLVLAVSMAFAAPLLRPVNEEAGGVHLIGGSSEGKTTAASVAGSVWGDPSRLETWRATINALEGVAERYNDQLLILDELKQIEPREAGETAYMLANGAGKRRGQRHGGTRPRTTWRLLFLSTGELSLEQHMSEAGKRAYAGQEARLVDVPANAGAGLGLFEQLHDADSAEAFARLLKAEAGECYGTAGREFLRRLVVQLDDAMNAVDQIKTAFVDHHVAAGASGQVYRVAGRFGLIAAGGELATRFGLTGWAEGEALSAAGVCFQAWIDRRGGYGNREADKAVEAVQRFIEQHGESRFQVWGNVGDTCPKCHGEGELEAYGHHQGGKCFDCDGTGQIGGKDGQYRVVLNRAGFRRPTDDGGTEYFVMLQAFRQDLAAGFDPAFVAKVLADRGHLRLSSEGKRQVNQRLPGIGPTKVYHLLPSILGDPDEDR